MLVYVVPNENSPQKCTDNTLRDDLRRRFGDFFPIKESFAASEDYLVTISDVICLVHSLVSVVYNQSAVPKTGFSL